MTSFDFAASGTEPNSVPDAVSTPAGSGGNAAAMRLLSAPAPAPAPAPAAGTASFRTTGPWIAGSLYRAHGSEAGTATQGVAGGTVHVFTARPKKSHSKKAAYVVFCGRATGVFRTWLQAEPLVKGVSNCIYRGYATLAAADAAFAYAVAQSWVRVCDAPLTAIPALPQPIHVEDAVNPLNDDEHFDGKWYIVYRGVTPGLYRSHLESQLNTLGVWGAIHESVVGTSAALAKFEAAARCGEIRTANPPAYVDFL
ncbi:hypothetical protein B0H19DRAFT_1259475 [Mycena capillaripes]|nr:hypothetical protein B0H19DRAFT_1259475 [Mycena capillaripes]